MKLSAASLALFWGPLLVLGAALLVTGWRRDRERPIRPVLAVAALAALLVTATTVALAWNAHQQGEAERDACLPLPDC